MIEKTLQFKKYLILQKKKAKKITLNQLKKWKVKFHKIYFGKPSSDFYIDDKALNVFDWLNGKNYVGLTLKYPVAEAADRYTICKLKHERKIPKSTTG